MRTNVFLDLRFSFNVKIRLTGRGTYLLQLGLNFVFLVEISTEGRFPITVASLSLLRHSESSFLLKVSVYMSNSSRSFPSNSRLATALTITQV